MATAGATRQALVDSALEVFALKGLHGARITDVTERAGVAAGSFYTHFASKDELFLEVTARLRDRATEGMPRARFADLASAHDWLREVLQTLVQRLSSGASIWRMVNAAALGDAQVAGLLRYQSDPLAELLATEFDYWLEQGWIDPQVPCPIAVEGVLAMTEQAVQQSEGGHDQHLDDAVETLAAAWIALLRMRSVAEAEA